MSYNQRRNEGRHIRNEARDRDYPSQGPRYHDNGEEDDYRDLDGNRNFIGNYTKSLPHHPLNHRDAGEVVNSAYRELIEAANTGSPREFEDIPLGSANPPEGTGRIQNPQRQTNPLAGKAFDLEGIDSHAVDPRLVPPAPRIDGTVAAGEMAELYWMALCRDIHFRDFGNEINTQSAIADLDARYTSPSWPRPVNANTLFRGDSPGDQMGPYVSQFLLKGTRDADRPDENTGIIKYGSLGIDQRQLTVRQGSDYMSDYVEWLDIQDGMMIPRQGPQDLSCGNNYDQRRFIRNIRDLANYVHYDDLPQEFINACLILIHMDAPCVNPQLTYSTGNPYRGRYQKQAGFGTFGNQHVLTLVTEVTTRAIKACWFQKWFVHRRLRPEAFSGLIHRQLNATLPANEKTPILTAPNPRYPIHNDILNSQVLHGDPANANRPFILQRNRQLNQQRFPQDPNRQKGTFLLPQAFPEGAPTHPAYTAGHATVAGACVTILKAFFDETFIIQRPVQANANGDALDLYQGPNANNLTVGGELNKLASNISLGRNMAGVHYRSDHRQSLRLGEEIAISILEDQRETYREKYRFRFTNFDGRQISIGN
jgi:hypothetical protein